MVDLQSRRGRHLIYGEKTGDLQGVTIPLSDENQSST